MPKLLIIACSPRRQGNSDQMAQWAQEVAQEKGWSVETVYLRDLQFRACTECAACEKDGICHLKDDLQKIYPLILEAEKIILAAPIFFQSLGGLAKSMIDRMQCFWASHFLLDKKIIPDEAQRSRRQLFAMLCGGTDLNDTFLCADKVLTIFGRTIEAKYVGGIHFPSIDAKGAILEEPIHQQHVRQQLDHFFTADIS